MKNLHLRDHLLRGSLVCHLVFTELCIGDPYSNVHLRRDMYICHFGDVLHATGNDRGRLHFDQY